MINYAFSDFMTECMKPSPKRPYEFSWEQKALWAFLFGVMLMVAIVGNCIVIWIVLGKCKSTFGSFKVHYNKCVF